MVNAGLGVSVNNRLQSINLKGNVVLKPFHPQERVALGLALLRLETASPALMRLVSMAREIAENSLSHGSGTPRRIKPSFPFRTRKTPIVRNDLKSP